MQNSILDDHRNMLMFSKNLSQFQINNLQHWPTIFFDSPVEAKVEWNFIDGDMFCAGKVSFFIKTENTHLLEKRIDYLIGATKALFWADTSVFITINDSVCYRD